MRRVERPASFALFLSVWNQYQGYDTPKIHFDIAQWLESEWRAGNHHLCLMAFRSCGKSTLVGLFSGWLLFHTPDMRILIVAAESELAEKMVANIRRIIEKHPFLAHLKPRTPEQWGRDRFTVQRELELRDPSVSARGITSNMTGCRADFIICDDVEVPNTADTAHKREELRARLSELDFILTQGGTQLYVGTPHAHHTLYTEQPYSHSDETYGFLKGFAFLKVPIINEAGQSVWPDKFTDKAIARLRKKSGPSRFQSQMMLESVNITEARLDVDLFQLYRGALVYSEQDTRPLLKLNGVRLEAASAWWDPAFGSKKGDASVFAVLFWGAVENIYIHSVAYIRNKPVGRSGDNSKGGEDEATSQARQICALIAQNYLSRITIETNGIGKFLPAILRRELVKAGIKCSVLEHHSHLNKAQRILEALEAPLHAQKLYLNADILSTPLPDEVREWRPDSAGCRDDGLDAIAGALSAAHFQMKTGFSTGQGKNWQSFNKTYRAKNLSDHN